MVELSYPGLIPARAGTAGLPLLGQTTAPAHPRAGGDGQVQAAAVMARQGSSPRGRGRHATGLPQLGDGGLIPARAGTADSPRYPRHA